MRNQALLILIKVYPSRVKELLSQLKQNPTETYDYRVHIRLYTTLLNNNFYEKLPRNNILDFISTSNMMDLGKAVEIKSEELKSALLKY